MPVHPKVKASTGAAAAAGIIVWLLGRYVLHGNVDATVTAEIYAAVPAALAFAAGWLTPAVRKPPAPEPVMQAPLTRVEVPESPLGAAAERVKGG
jgi:hypothetical protein